MRHEGTYFARSVLDPFFCGEPVSTVKALFFLVQGFRVSSLGLEGVREVSQDWKNIEQDCGSVGRRCHDLLEGFKKLLQSRIVDAYYTIAEYKLCRLTVTIPFEVFLEQLRCFQDPNE